MYRDISFEHEKNLNLDDLIVRLKAYYSDTDFELLKKAYHFATDAHKDQKRSSGEDYIIHPINVAAILIKLRMDMESIISGILHDVVEDCNVSVQTLEKEFGEDIAQIVAGLTKISQIKFKNIADSQAENFRKMIIAMAKDIRVIIVKMADRMHNMETLQYVSEIKQKKVARETLDIYVPMAGRLGINSIKTNLEDLCLRFLRPDIYRKMEEKAKNEKSMRDTYVQNVVNVIKDKLAEYSVKAEVSGKVKHLYSLYRKMLAQDVGLDQIQDIFSFKIISDNITECYKILGIIHSHHTPVPGRFKDYIAIPKVNGYQSLHTTVIGPQAERIEIQILTYEMHETAEMGITTSYQSEEKITGQHKQFSWIKQLLEIDKSIKSNFEFMDTVKGDLDVGEVFVFSPAGDIQKLCHGATPLDFAYAIHTEVGHRCVGAKVNNRITSLRHILKSGDTIEILTNESQTPSKDWLNIVKSPRSKTKIKQWLVKTERKQKRKVGQEAFEKMLALLETSFDSIEKSEEFANVLKHFNISNQEEFFLAIGRNEHSIQDIVKTMPSLKDSPLLKSCNKQLDEIINYSKKVQKDHPVIIDNIETEKVRLAKCCNPIPGDTIIGQMIKNKDVIIHRVNCPKSRSNSDVKSIKAEWNQESTLNFYIKIKVITEDKPGILSIISNSLSKMKTNIKSVNAHSSPTEKRGEIIFEIEVKNNSELSTIISSLELIDEIASVFRLPTSSKTQGPEEIYKPRP